jgi:hypothetical protein
VVSSTQPTRETTARRRKMIADPGQLGELDLEIVSR